MKIFLILLITLISNSILAEFKLKIDHHGNVVNPISLSKTQIDLQAVEFDKELKFSSELIKQHLKRVSEIVPVNTFVVLYGDENGIVNEYLTGFYVISGVEYILTQPGPVRMKLKLQRREFTPTT